MSRFASTLRWIKDNKDFVEQQAKDLERDFLKKKAAGQKRRHDERRKTDPDYRLLGILRCRVKGAVKHNWKSAKTEDLLGCSIEDLRKHLERQFQPGMTWENQGKWHIDHIRPCCSFDLSKEEEQKKCFHWSNLQPLWASDNFKKSGKWNPLASTTQ